MGELFPAQRHTIPFVGNVMYGLWGAWDTTKGNGPFTASVRSSTRGKTGSSRRKIKRLERCRQNPCKKSWAKKSRRWTLQINSLVSPVFHCGIVRRTGCIGTSRKKMRWEKEYTEKEINREYEVILARNETLKSIL